MIDLRKWSGDTSKLDSYGMEMYAAAERMLSSPSGKKFIGLSMSEGEIKKFVSQLHSVDSLKPRKSGFTTWILHRLPSLTNNARFGQYANMKARGWNGEIEGDFWGFIYHYVLVYYGYASLARFLYEGRMTNSGINHRFFNSMIFFDRDTIESISPYVTNIPSFFTNMKFSLRTPATIKVLRKFPRASIKLSDQEKFDFLSNDDQCTFAAYKWLFKTLKISRSFINKTFKDVNGELTTIFTDHVKSSVYETKRLLSIIQFLVSKGASVGKKVESLDFMTPRQWCVKNGSREVLKAIKLGRMKKENTAMKNRLPLFESFAGSRYESWTRGLYLNYVQRSLPSDSRFKLVSPEEFEEKVINHHDFQDIKITDYDKSDIYRLADKRRTYLDGHKTVLGHVWVEDDMVSHWINKDAFNM